MARGKFEEDIKKKFEGNSVDVPNDIWDNIDAELNVSLLKSYSKKNNRYKWASIAAILLAFGSLASQFFTFESTKKPISAVSGYNALLERNYHSTRTPQRAWLPLSSPIFKPVIIHQKNDVPVTYHSPAFDKKESEDRNFPEIHKVASKRYPEYKINLKGDIHPYIQAIPNHQSRPRRSIDEADLWAGVEVGAGNFNSLNLNSLTSGIDPIRLASAVGNDGFVSPSTSITPELNSGLAASIGVNLGIKLGQKWALEAGVSYTNVTSNGKASIDILDTYTSDASITTVLEGDGTAVQSSLRETELIIEETFNHNVDVSSSTQFTSVPVQVGYLLLDRKMSLKLNVGFATNYFVTSNLKDENSIIEGSLDNAFNQWSFDGLGGVEIGYTVLKDLDFILNPNYRQAITPITNGSGSNGRFILQTGLKCTL